MEAQNTELRQQTEAKTAELRVLAEEGELRSKELSTLRNRTNLSQQNWVMEKQELVERESSTREEFEAAKQAMHDWEVLAMEERSIREDLGGKVADLEEQVASYKEAYENAASERENQSATVDGLQRALQEIQTGEQFRSGATIPYTDSLTNKLERRSFGNWSKALRPSWRS